MKIIRFFCSEIILHGFSITQKPNSGLKFGMQSIRELTQYIYNLIRIVIIKTKKTKNYSLKFGTKIYILSNLLSICFLVLFSKLKNISYNG